MARIVTNRVVHAATPTPAAPVESVADVVQPDAPRIVSIPNVVIAEVGQWATCMGDGTMTRDDLAAAVAATTDPGFRAAPKGKPGHFDPRFDGTPGIGRFANFRLSADGMQLIADHVGLFEWQRTLVQIAWPNRSVEAVRGCTSTATWRTYGFVITAVALLGVEWPAVATLEDLELWVTDEGPPAAQDAVAASVRRNRDDDIQQEEDAVAKRQSAPEAVKASANIDQVRRDFIAWCDAGGHWSWWIRELWLDPNEVIVDDDAGHLFRVPFTVTDGGVDFGAAVPVEVSYVDAAPEQGEAVAASRPSFAAVYANRSESRPAITNDQEGTMDTAAIIAALGLPADTTDEQAQAALAAAQEAGQAAIAAGDSGTTDDGEGAGGEGDGGEGGEGAGGETVTASAATTAGGFTPPEGTVLVDAAQFARMNQFMETVNAEREAEVKASRDRTVADAVKAGKIAPADRDKWRTALDKAPEENGAILASLAPTVPVEERGTSAAADADGDDTYPASWSKSSTGVDMRRG